LAEKQAQRLFRALMDNLHHRFSTMGSIYVRERQEEGGIHYHVLFHFFDAQALPFPRSRMAERMRATVFPIWNRMQNGGLARAANRLTVVKRSADYFLRKIELPLPGERSVRSKARWWGFWNQDLLRKNTVTPTRKSVDSEMEWHFDSERQRERVKRFNRHPAEPKRRVFARANIRYLKQTVYEISFEGWKAYKQRVAGQGHPVTSYFESETQSRFFIHAAV